jgi:hypothetical protein
LLFNHLADHPAFRDGFALGNAHADLAGAGHGNGPFAHNRVAFGLLLGNAPAGVDLVLLFANFRLASIDLDGHRLAGANLLATGNLALDNRRAGDPALDGPGAGAWLAALGGASVAAATVATTAGTIAAITAAGVAAAAAATLLAPVVEEFAEPFLQCRSTGDLTAFVVPLVDALANGLGAWYVADAGLVDGPFFAARNLHTHLAGAGLALRNQLVAAHGARALFRVALGLAGRVALFFPLFRVHGTGTLVLFGHPLLHTDGAILRGARGRWGAVLSWGIVIVVIGLGPSGQSRHGQDSASQQGNAQMLPKHAFSFVA